MSISKRALLGELPEKEESKKTNPDQCERYGRSDDNCVCNMPWHGDSPDYEGEDWEDDFY